VCRREVDRLRDSLAFPCSRGDDLLVCDLDELAESPARRLFLRDRRPELYDDWITA
jgi:hypothetical protein